MSFVYNYLFGKAASTEVVETPVAVEPYVETVPQVDAVITLGSPQLVNTFSYHIEYDDYDGDDNSVASFILEVAGGCKVRIVLFDPDTKHLKLNWEKLFQEDPTTKITMCGSNGEVEINADQNNTEFVVSKHGAGGDGEITVTIPNAIAIPVLKEFYTAWTERQAKFAKTE